MFTDMKSERYL